MPSKRLDRVRTIALRLATLLPVCLAAVGCGLNFHEVEPGVLYTSGQPEPEQLVELHRRHGFGTLVNLRGPHPGTEWYPFEKRFAADNNIVFVDLDLSRTRGPTPEQVRTLERLFDDPEAHPILIHCWRGTDRSGVVEAMYRIRNHGWPTDRVMAELADNGFASLFFPTFTAFIHDYGRTCRRAEADRSAPEKAASD